MERITTMFLVSEHGAEPAFRHTTPYAGVLYIGKQRHARKKLASLPWYDDAASNDYDDNDNENEEQREGQQYENSG